jgi:uncharacterized protein YjgD (DUF1641 family)
MSDKPMLKPSNGDGKMAAQIDDIYSKFHMVENIMSDLMPAVEKISKDLQPTIRDLRIKYERDETLDLIMKVGDNIPMFLQLFDMMKVAQGMMEDMMPAVGKITHDAQPVIKDMRERFEREETLDLMKKVGDNIPVFLQLFDMMKVARGMMEDMMPAVEKIMHDVQPVIKDMRERFEREETLELIYKLGDDIPVFLILLNLLSKKEMHYLIRGADKCAISAMQDIVSNPVQPGIKNLISAVMDPEVQKGLIMLTKFAKHLPKSINEAIAETKALEEAE